MAKKKPKGKKQEFLNLFSSLRKEASIKECTLAHEINDLCEGKIVNAHSIQRGKILQSISEKGEVFSLACEINDEDMSLAIQFKTIGIKRFSTFSGFCQKHDKYIFQPIEDHAFNNTLEQITIYAYRAIAKELHTKKEARRLNSIYVRDLTLSKQYINDIGDLKNLSNYVYSKIVNNQFNELIHYSYVLDEFYPIACNSVFIPYFDTEGNKLFSDREYKHIQSKIFMADESPFIMLNIFPEEDKTYVLVSHVASRCNDFGFLKSIFDKPPTDFTSSISEIMLTHCENICFSPSYIDTRFNNQEKQKIKVFFTKTMENREKYFSNEINLFRSVKIN